MGSGQFVPTGSDCHRVLPRVTYSTVPLDPHTLATWVPNRSVFTEANQIVLFEKCALLKNTAQVRLKPFFIDLKSLNFVVARKLAPKIVMPEVSAPRGGRARLQA